MGNAFKFTKSGSIKLETEILSTTSDSVKINFKVHDTGIGIKPLDIEKLFKPFTQLDSSYTKEYKGTGLGLSITKEIVSAMGGSIGVTSVPGEGSTFHVTLEFKIVSTSDQITISKTSAINTEQWPQGELKILVAEDDVWIRLALVDLLRGKGYAVTEALDGAEAMELAKSNKYSAIFMDVGMPTVNGFDATKNIRNASDSLNKETNVIFTTGHTIENELALTEGLNVTFLQKPYSEEELRLIMRKIYPEEQ